MLRYAAFSLLRCGTHVCFLCCLMVTHGHTHTHTHTHTDTHTHTHTHTTDTHTHTLHLQQYGMSSEVLMLTHFECVCNGALFGGRVDGEKCVCVCECLCLNVG